MNPAAGGERILGLDALRGLALGGILLVNMATFRGPEGGGLFGPADRAAQFAIEWLAEGKFNALFSFLFGIGVALQGARARGRLGFQGMAARRMTVLLVIGLLHGILLWYGDVLQLYALLGFGLLALRRSSERTLAVVAVAAMLIPVAFVRFLHTPSAGTSEMVALVQAGERTHRSAGYGEAVAFRVEFWTMLYTSPVILALGGELFSTMLLGLWAGRRRAWEDPRMVSAALRWALPAGLLLNLAQPFDDGSLGAAAVHVVGRPLLMAGYAAAGWRWAAAEGPGVRAAAAAGRMALTNYLLQSVICTLLFYGYGGGWYGLTGAAAGVGLAAAVWAGQAVLSRWWLGAFRFGPVEWLWRSLSYQRWQPMRGTG